MPKIHTHRGSECQAQIWNHGFVLFQSLPEPLCNRLHLFRLSPGVLGGKLPALHNEHESFLAGVGEWVSLECFLTLV